MPFSYPEAFELSVELQIAKCTGRHLSRVSMVQAFSYEFCKTFKNTYFEEYLRTTAFGYRLENHVEIEPQRFTTFTLFCLHYHLCRQFFFLLLFTISFCIFILVFETKLAIRKLYGELRQFLKYKVNERDLIQILRRQIW